ncbi:MAG: helix-turn-helix domain-containing protein [Roseomonas sp.]|nr:helix-turn-helix domain-containing protein [Roseomonas sp.]
MAEPARHFTVAGLATHWQVSTTHVYGLIQAGRLGHIRIGAAIRIRQIDIDAFEAQAWHAPSSIGQSPASPNEAAVIPLNSGGKGAHTAFQRAQQMSAKRTAP